MADPVTMAIGNLALGVFSGQMKGEATRLAIAEQTEANNDMAAEYRADIKGANQLYADAKTNTDFAQKTIMGGMKDIAAENKYAVGLTAQKGALETGATKAKLGYSGVTGASPLAVLQQQERLASEELGATTASANASLVNKGYEYTAQGNALTTKALETSLLTKGYQNKIALLNKNSKYLKDNANKMWWMSFLGAAPDTISNVSNWVSKADPAQGSFAVSPKSWAGKK